MLIYYHNVLIELNNFSRFKILDPYINRFSVDPSAGTFPAIGIFGGVEHKRLCKPEEHTGRAAIRGMATFAEIHPTIEKKMVQIWGKGVRAGYIPCTETSLLVYHQEITTTR